MKTLAIALATALVAGAGVYAWRNAELADRQSRLLEAVLDQTEAEIQAEHFRLQLDRLRAELSDLARARCRGISSGSIPSVTFVQNQRLMSVGLKGGQAKCLVDSGPVGPGAEWGPRADRLLLSGTSYLGATKKRVLPLPQIQPAHWSRPQGTSIVYSEDEGRRLLKVSASGGAAEDISFLKRHDSFVYHPAGTHIAVSGENAKGQLGIYIATNTGADPFLVARGENATLIDGLQFSAGGRHLFFVAHHDDEFHLHDLGITTGERQGDVRRALSDVRLRTLMASDDLLGRPVVSPFVSRQPLVAFSRGECSTRTETYVRIDQDAVPIEWAVPGEQTQPLAWLPDGRLLLEVKPAGSCSNGGSLQVWDPETEEHSILSPDIDVGQVAVRARLPKPPDPPVPAQEVPA